MLKINLYTKVVVISILSLLYITTSNASESTEKKEGKPLYLYIQNEDFGYDHDEFTNAQNQLAKKGVFLAPSERSNSEKGTFAFCDWKTGKPISDSTYWMDRVDVVGSLVLKDKTGFARSVEMPVYLKEVVLKFPNIVKNDLDSLTLTINGVEYAGDTKTKNLGSGWTSCTKFPKDYFYERKDHFSIYSVVRYFDSISNPNGGSLGVYFYYAEKRHD